MARKGWHILRKPDGLVLTRHLPPRFDVMGHGWLPAGRPLALAQQIRQDLWRLLQAQRGFSPVVALTAADTGWQVQAGGRLSGPVAKGLAARIDDMLQDPKRRVRWVTQARRHSEKGLA
ncbi:MAG: hypothetical protein HRU31_16410 [Rhodobacteraceae bacterium]|nr:hypothetical protein [Paracoccaceae bacterium]